MVRKDVQGNPYGVDFFQSLDDLAKAVESADRTSIQRGVSEVDALQTGVSQGLGVVGADMTVIDMQNAVLDQVLLQLKTTRSDTEDLDYTEAASRLNKEQLALEAAQNSFAKISQLSLFKYLS